MRRGTAKPRKVAGAAVMAAIEVQMQRRTKHEIYKHQRNMEQVRLPTCGQNAAVYQLCAYAERNCRPRSQPHRFCTSC
jgi:hypothetical protein